jgi:hypothetical protein
MSVKSLLPIFGVGSAVALLGLAAARRHSNQRAARLSEQRLGSGVHPRVILDDEGPFDPAFAAAPLTSEFWDAEPVSYPLSEHSAGASLDADDSLDSEDLTAEWLARATQAPAIDDPSDADYVDDPAEIAADSLSMISDASRRAAAFEPDEPEPSSEYEPVSEQAPPSEIASSRS